MVADISYPDFETRMAILKLKLQNTHSDFYISDEILGLIAEKFPYNIRELEGALTRLLGILKIRKLNPTRQNIESLLDEITSQRVMIIAPEVVIKIVSEFYNIPEKDLLSHSRKKELVKPRQIIMYILREYLKYSFPTIARKLGDRDHTTVLHAYNKISQQLNKDHLLTQEINLIKEKIYNKH